MLFSDTQEFLKLLEPLSDQHLFTCFYPQNQQPPDPKKIFHPRIIMGAFNENERTLEEYNRQGYGIYVTINKCTKRERTNSNIAYPRAIYQDDDHAFHGEYPLQPNVVVHTSQGKYQRYWFIEKASLDDFKGNIWKYWEDMQQVLTSSFGNDRSVNDRARVFRLPGFKHTKDGYNPKGPLIEYEIINEVPYSFHDLVAAFHTSNERQIYAQDSAEAKANKLVQAMDNILTGDNYNDALGTLSMHFINKRYPQNFVLSLLNGLMLQSAQKDTIRWQERMDHLPRQLAAGYKKTDIENGDELIPIDQFSTGNYRYKDLPMPPGFLGELAQDIYKSMYYPEMNIAIVGAMHVMFAFGGRQYTFEGQGLVYKQVLLAPPGRGKNTISNYMKSLITALEDQYKLREAAFYLGGSDFTTAALIHNELAMWGCRSFIRYEAGQARKSTAGDLGAFHAYVLQILGNSYNDSIRVKSQRIKQGDHEGPLYQISFAMLDESVPETYIEALRTDNAFITGDMARLDLIMADPKLSFINKDSQNYKPSQRIIEHMAQYINDNSKLSSPRGADRLRPDQVHQVQASQEVQALLHDIDNKVFNMRNATVDSPVENSTYQRYSQKLRRLALLLSVSDKNPGNDPLVSPTHIQWADQYLTILKDTLLDNMTSGIFENFSTRAESCLHEHIQNILQGKVKLIQPIAPELLHRQILTKSALKRNLNQRKAIQELAEKKFRGDVQQAQEHCVQYFIKEGYLRELTLDEKRDIVAQGWLTKESGITVFKYLVKFDPEMLVNSPA